MCCFACLDKYKCNAREKKTIVADLFGNNLHFFSYNYNLSHNTWDMSQIAQIAKLKSYRNLLCSDLEVIANYQETRDLCSS